MKRSDYEGYLKELGWSYWRQCGTCTAKKYYYRRGTDVLLALPGRDYYEFTENGTKKSGKLSKLNEVVKSAKG